MRFTFLTPAPLLAGPAFASPAAGAAATSGIVNPLQTIEIGAVPAGGKPKEPRNTVIAGQPPAGQAAGWLHGQAPC